MRFGLRSGLTIFFGILLIITGIIFLARGCLSRYNERFAKAPLLYVEKEGKQVVLSLVEFQRAVSYSRSGGFVRKSVSTTFYLQSSDAATAATIRKVKLKKASSVKHYPLEAIAASQGNGWFFVDGLMAFDALTLEKIADGKIIEEKNPGLTGKLPEERRFYQYDPSDGHIYITATDGGRWKLNLQTLVAAETNDDPDKGPYERQMAQLEQQEKANRDAQDSLYRQKNMQAAEDYRAGRISAGEYQRLQKTYYADRERLTKQRDSLQEIRQELYRRRSDAGDLERALDNLNRENPGYSSMKTGQDTLGGRWFGLYSAKELNDLYERVQYNAPGDNASRRKFWIAGYSFDRNKYALFDKDEATAPGNDFFLDGGFLLDKRTARPARPGGKDDRLIVHREKVGNDAAILVSRIGAGGKTSWTVNTSLPEWGDWVITDRRLIILGSNNKELSRSENNLLLSIDLEDGNVKGYDFFTDKMTKGN